MSLGHILALPQINNKKHMELTLGIPALLFPAISLTMLAYNARYLAIAALIRQLHQKYQETASQSIGLQVQKLSKRLTIIKNMQATAIFSFLLAVITMALLFLEYAIAAKIVFGISLFALILSLVLSLIEVQLSTKALSIQLKDMEK
jgi:phosphoglycerol transferase MdoB-like AlkP superfamily enzyme